MRIPLLINSRVKRAERLALLDSGATQNFLHPSFIRHHKIETLKLEKPRTVRNVDGTKNKAGDITDYARLQVKTNGQQETMNFYVSDLGNEEIILGYPWLAKFNPTINWKEKKIEDGPFIITVTTNNAKKYLPVSTQKRGGLRRRLVPLRKQYSRTEDDRYMLRWSLTRYGMNRP